MNKRMRELQAQIAQKSAEAKGYTEGENKDISKAQGLLEEIKDLQKELDVLADLEKVNKGAVPTEPVATEKADGFKTMAKMLNRQAMTETEKAALITGENAANGENYLVPDDVRTEINELRKSYVSARDLVTVMTTNSLAGSVNYEAGAPAGLTEFDDGDAITEETGMKFVRKSFAIKFLGKLIPVSRILQGAERAGLMNYINRWFMRNAIISENSAIFAALAAGYNNGTAKAVAGWAALKKSITVDLDPSCLLNGVIATNQTGFAILDAEVDENGRPILQPNPANPTEKLFQGLPIKVYPDTQLANVSDTVAPIIYGDIKAGATFVEHQSLEFAVSEHYGFNKNQTYLRVIEGFDVMSTDASAYVYGNFSATV